MSPIKSVLLGTYMIHPIGLIPLMIQLFFMVLKELKGI
jgi:hypothetical protein